MSRLFSLVTSADLSVSGPVGAIAVQRSLVTSGSDAGEGHEAGLTVGHGGLESVHSGLVTPSLCKYQGTEVIIITTLTDAARMLVILAVSPDSRIAPDQLGPSPCPPPVTVIAPHTPSVLSPSDHKGMIILPEVDAFWK